MIVSVSWGWLLIGFLLGAFFGGKVLGGLGVGK
jgi:hypothetical protein